MRTQFTTPTSSWSFLLTCSRKLLANTSLLVSMATMAALPVSANTVSTANPSPQSNSIASLADGVYLYGQSAQPEQVGKGYFVFEVNQGSVVGALYMPRSSFDCASGTFQQNQLALNVVNSYDRSTNPFEIALEKASNVATAGNPAVQKVGLQGFQQLATLSENDRRILGICKADLQRQAKGLQR